MSKTRGQKEEMVEEYTDNLKRMKAAAIVSVFGYTMSDADALRQKGREAGVEFKVAKKTLIKRAVEAAGVKDIDPVALEGSLLWGFGYEDEVAPAKLLAELVKGKETIHFVGGILEGKFIGPSAVAKLATLPSKQQLLGKLVGTLNAPVSGFVNVLAGNLRGLVGVLSAIKEQKV